jgi:hypothetical protein
MRRLLPLTLIVAGCSHAASKPPEPNAAPPKFPILAAGQSVMVGIPVAPIRPTSGHPFEKGDPEFVDCFVAEGDRGIVLDDEGTPADDRETKVRMETGGKAGRSYLLMRAHLVPLNTPRP